MLFSDLISITTFYSTLVIRDSHYKILYSSTFISWTSFNNQIMSSNVLKINIINNKLFVYVDL